MNTKMNSKMEENIKHDSPFFYKTKEEYKKENDFDLTRIRQDLLAYRFHNSRQIDEKNKERLAKKLKEISLTIYSRCNYMQDSDSIEMKNGEMLVVKDSSSHDTFYICADYIDFNNALSDYSFTECVIEALCITLEESSSDMVNSFRRIIRDSLDNNNYIADKELNDDDTKNLDKLLGLSNKEKSFWETVFIKKSIDIDKDKIPCGLNERYLFLQRIITGINLPSTRKDIEDMTSEEQYNLMLSLGIDDASILGENGLKSFYEEKFKNYCQQYLPKFRNWAYNKEYQGEELKPYQFFNLCREYVDMSWVTDKINEIKYQLLKIQKLKDIFICLIKERFGICIKDYIEQQYEIRHDYIKIMEDAGLSESNFDQRILSLTYFDGFEEEFKREMERQYPKESTQSNTTLSESTPVSIFYCDNGLQVDNEKRDSNNHSYHKNILGRGYRTSVSKEKAGKNAEKLVFNALSYESKHYKNVRGCSRILDPLNGKDDLGYDIAYEKILKDGSTQQRYLEVKHMSVNSIILSDNELKFGKENKDIYDFAIVKDGTIYIIECPYGKVGKRNPYEPIPDTYKIYFDINKMENSKYNNMID